MSKITFRAEDDLVERLEDLDTSKSEAMREALRAYLDTSGHEGRPGAADADGTSIDGVIRERVDELVADRLDALLGDRPAAVGRSQDLRVNVTVDGVAAAEPGGTADTTAYTERTDVRKTPANPAEQPAGEESASDACAKCGESVDADHVYCPNCGEKAAHRVFCECGDELQSDWAFCPGCGRRTSAADVLDRP